MLIDYSDTIYMFTGLEAYQAPNIVKIIDDISRYKLYRDILRYMDIRFKIYLNQILLTEEQRKCTSFETDGELYHVTSLLFGVTM